MAASTTTVASSGSARTVLLVLFLAACFHAAVPKAAGGDSSDLVAGHCANATRDFCHMHLTSKYCVSTLRSHTRSARAQTPRELALVAIDLARRGAAAADAKAAGALERKISEEDARSLRYCRSDYVAVARLAAMCRGLVEAYSPGDGMRMYYNVECATKLVHAATNCGHLARFVGAESEAALRKEFIDVARRTALVKAMVELMIGVEDPIEGFEDDFDYDA
ncbi:hypothetical protein PVAP13_1NG347800 [Panicum virgatum]|uniref:Pectinesterase inhibitor domain-containing protein n=1 Tax=Panicum virgatum TaxID=38727 RepID=A0A8T0X0G5_PANVG|nr:hypothetical protein PVAP13_1NG347800 [Panicum virgatum]